MTIGDLNGPKNLVADMAQQHIVNGERYNVIPAYLEKANDNLDIKVNALVTKILFKGNKAVGVEYLDENVGIIGGIIGFIFGSDIKRTVFACKEVIVSGG